MHKKLPNIFIFIDKYNNEIFKKKNTNIGIVYRNYDDENRAFKNMYGADASFINATNMMEVAKTMNKKFLQK